MSELKVHWLPSIYANWKQGVEIVCKGVTPD